MADTGTCTHTRTRRPGGWIRDTFSWTSDSSGNVTKTITKEGCYGYAQRLDTDPTDGPTANYDITINDDDGIDMLAGNGANRHTTTTESVAVDLDNGAPAAMFSAGMVFGITGAGDTKSGVAYLTWREVT